MVAAGVAAAATAATAANSIANSGGPSGSVTSNQNVTPYNADQLQQLYARANDLYSSHPLQAYTGQTYAPPSMFQIQGNQMLGDRGMAGSPLLRQSQGLAQDTLAGKYLSPDSNPWLQSTYDHAANALEGASRSAWGGADTLPGSSGVQQAALANAQANLGNSIFGTNYQNERKNQLGTMTLAPGMAQADYADINAVTQAGNQQQQLGQQALNDAQARFQAQQMAPYQNLAQYQSFIGGPSNGATSMTSPYFTNPLGSALGAGIGGLSLYNGINQATGGSTPGAYGTYNPSGSIFSGVGNWFQSNFGSGPNGYGYNADGSAGLGPGLPVA